VNESIHILLSSDTESLRLEGGLALKLPPPLLLEIETQGYDRSARPECTPPGISTCCGLSGAGVPPPRRRRPSPPS